MQVLTKIMQIWIKVPHSTQTISVLLFDNFSNYCLANAVEPFRAANTIARKPLYSWHFLSMEGGTVTSSSGLPVETQEWSKITPSGDYLFVMPSYGFERFTSQSGPLLRTARARFKVIAGFDTGAWLLAAAGLLKDRKTTIHWDEFTRFSETFPDTYATEDRFIVEDDLATCGGAATAIELSLKLIERAHTPMFALEVAALFMFGDRLELHDPYHRATTDELVRKAAALMRRNVEMPLSIPTVAERLNVDQRALEEVFNQFLKAPPRKVYKSIRLREARRLVELSTLQVAEIATRCGYQNASALTRAYREEFGETPRAHRGAN